MTDMTLPEAPLGWFAAALSSGLEPGRVLSKKLCGREIVLFRSEKGVPCVADAHCPHLGSHLRSGVVEDDCLCCPFHGFRFGVDGGCVGTGYESKPPHIRLGTWPLEERNGVLFVYHDPLRRQPTWQLPHVESFGWTPPLFKCIETEAHPQEMSENPVDIGHLTWNHGYRDVQMMSPPRFDSHVFRVSYKLCRFFGWRRLGRAVPLEFSVEVNGFGFTQIETLLPDSGVRTRLIAMSTPTESGRVSLLLSLSVAHTLEPRNQRPILTRIWTPMLAAAAARVLFPFALRDVEQDLPMWRGKQHLARPGIVRGDGPLMPYRHWAQQFYLPTAGDLLRDLVTPRAAQTEED